MTRNEDRCLPTIKTIGSYRVISWECAVSVILAPNPSMVRPQPRFFVPFVSSWWKIADVTKDTLPVRKSPIG